MKKIDIEKWERKMPELPENFFDEMQERVLEQTIYKKEPKRFRLNWAWSSAAALAIVFGLAFLLQKTPAEQELQVISHDEKIEVNNEILAESAEVIKDNADVLIEKEDKILVAHKMKTIAQKTEKKTRLGEKEQQTKERMEKILNAMCEEDFVDLAGNYEQDVYLELY